MTVSGLVVQEQDLVAHLFAPMDGPHAGDAHAGIRQLWSQCRDGLGMTEPIPLPGLPAQIPDNFAALPDVAVVAGQQSPGAGFQAILRRDHDVLNLSVLLAGANGRGASPPLWPELDRLWAVASLANTSALIGVALLYLGKAADPAAAGEDLDALLPCAPAPAWRGTGLSTKAAAMAWELSQRDDLRAERRFVVVGRPDTDAELSTWTWSSGDASMPPFARYLMHMAKIRYELRVRSGGPPATMLCQHADDAIAAIRALASANEATRDEEHRAALASQARALRRTGVQVAETRTALSAMRRTAEIAEENAAKALGADLPSGTGPDFASDDRAVARHLGQLVDDDLAYLDAALQGVRQVSELTDGILGRQPPDLPAGASAGRAAARATMRAADTASPPASRYRGTAVVLCALNVEYLAVRPHLTGLRLREHPAGTRFETGELVAGDWQVTLAAIGPGNVGAAVITERAITLFRPDVVLCVGVAGSLKDNVELGDVVVATRVDAYHGGTATKDFLARPRTWPAPYRLDQLARELGRDDSWRRFLPAPADGRPPVVHFRPIAAGEVVLDSRDATLFAQLRLHHNDAAAIEMEGAGIVQAAHFNDALPALVIRGISDRADGTKMTADRDGWQQRASANAAAFAAALLERLIPPAAQPTYRQDN
jgi:nucleoside phosphorylase